MTIAEIIHSLSEQAEDKDSMLTYGDPTSIFANDAQALREAAGILREFGQLLYKAAESEDGVCVLCKYYSGEITSAQCWSCTSGKCKFEFEAPEVQTSLFEEDAH